MKQIIAIDNGFIFIGVLRYNKDETITISECYNFRRYGTKNGIGEIALNGIQKETIIDPIGILTIPSKRLLFLIDCTHESFK